MTPTDTLIHNERLKLTATWLNTLATATIAAAVLAPITLIINSLETGAEVHWALLIGSLIFVPVGVSLHLAGRWMLGSLQQ